MADELNFQIPKQGFDSYLYGIIPDDQAVLAGAFSVSMQQVRNIDKVTASQFAKVAYSMESTVGLPLTNGTDIPTDTPLLTEAKVKTSLGSGVYGSYTTSNFFGAMSGLPYPWANMYDKIKELETQTLYTIYQNLYLAVQWEQATATVQYSSYDDGFGTTYYHVEGVTIADQGGGYLRENAAPPTITINGGSGATATLTMGTDVNSVGSDGGGQYGRVLTATLTSSGTDTTTIPTATITAPPGGGWPAMNIVVQGYIDAANNEIQAITTRSAQNFNASNVLNTLWNITGIALKHEQRARYIAMAPVPVPWDNRVSSYPTSLYVMVDGIPDFAKQTEPHMAAQTLEHISDLLTAGGQSVVAMMRQERNQDRLAEVGIELDNNLADRLSVDLTRQLMSNGVLPGAVEGIESPNGNIYTLPAWPEDTDPVAYWDCDESTIRIATGLKEGDINPLLDGNECPIVNPEVPEGEGPIPEPPINIFVVEDPLPPEINTDYTGTTLKPSTYDIPDAIDKVIECNCDCWVN
jgi:hypothetical protein